jgi:hypothetical protein
MKITWTAADAYLAFSIGLALGSLGTVAIGIVTETITDWEKKLYRELKSKYK